MMLLLSLIYVKSALQWIPCVSKSMLVELFLQSHLEQQHSSTRQRVFAMSERSCGFGGAKLLARMCWLSSCLKVPVKNNVMCNAFAGSGSKGQAVVFAGSATLFLMSCGRVYSPNAKPESVAKLSTIFRIICMYRLAFLDYLWKPFWRMMETVTEHQ